MFADTHGDGAVAAGHALVHDIGREQAVQPEEVLVRDGLGLFGALLDPAEPGEVVEDFAAGALGMDRQRGPALEGADFLQREGIALDGGGSVRAALTAVLGELGRPRDLNGGRGDPSLELGNGLQLPEQPGGDGELRLEAPA